MIYAIYEGIFSEVERKLNRIIRKCEKHGNPFTFEVKGEEIRENINEETGAKEYYKFILVEVEGTAKIDDWEAVAVLEIHNGGNIIRRINTAIDIPERFKHTENICEHCNSKRQRKNLYIIHNTKTDDWKQVGGSCLKLYTNGLNMEYVTAFFDGITELEENDGIFYRGGKPYIPIYEVLSYAVEVVEKAGYFNSQAFPSTKWIVSEFLSKNRSRAIEDINHELYFQKSDLSFSMDDFGKENTEYTIDKIVDYYTNLEDNSEFIHNIKVILNEGYVQIQNIGFLCYLPQGYKKHLQKEEERIRKEKIAANSNHFGEIGKRYKEKEIQHIDLVTCWETMYGTTYIYKIILADGTNLIWKTSNWFCLEDKFDKVTFTVKGHNEYKGEKQTEVTRCKITYI